MKGFLEIKVGYKPAVLSREFVRITIAGAVGVQSIRSEACKLHRCYQALNLTYTEHMNQTKFTEPMQNTNATKPDIPSAEAYFCGPPKLQAHESTKVKVVPVKSLRDVIRAHEPKARQPCPSCSITKVCKSGISLSNGYAS